MFPLLSSRIQGWMWSWCLRCARGLPCGHFYDPNLLRQGPARGSRLACNFPPLPMTAVQPPNWLAEKGIKPMDALHVASAIEAGATWFLTTDHVLLRKMKSESRLSVVDPVDFIRMLQE